VLQDDFLSMADLRLSRAVRIVRARVREEAGYTLFELLTVLVIMGVVLTGLTTSFAAGLNAEAGTIRRAQAQQNARLALGRMRTDIHCASGAPAPQENPYGGFTLTLTESPNVCPVVTTSSSGVQWCTIPYSGSTTHWQLFRFLGTQLSDCGGGGVSTVLVDYITAPASGWPSNSGTSPAPADWDGNLWPTAASCAAGSLPAVALSMTVNVDPDTHPEGAYNLSDSIALRNALRCT
jgi:prepilin-type N-terminal cleavage/methylation domain-containing protein